MSAETILINLYEFLVAGMEDELLNKEIVGFLSMVQNKNYSALKKYYKVFINNTPAFNKLALKISEFIEMKGEMFEYEY